MGTEQAKIYHHHTPRQYLLPWVDADERIAWYGYGKVDRSGLTVVGGENDFYKLKELTVPDIDCLGLFIDGLPESGRKGHKRFLKMYLLPTRHGGFVDAVWAATEDDNLDDCAPPPVTTGSPETPCHSQKTSLSFVPGSNAEYYDLIERSTGTGLVQTPNGWKVQDVTGTHLLRLVSGKYTDLP